MENINIVYCICLENRKDHMNKFFKTIKINNVNYINPILGYDLKKKFSYSQLITKKFITEDHNLYKDNIFNYNKLANTLSFIKLLKEFLLTKYENCIIFEDDLKIPNDKELFLLNYRLKLLFNKISNINWQYINLGRCWDRSCSKNKKYNDSYFEVEKCSPVCTHAILLKRKISKFLIDNTLPLKNPKDNTWRNIIHLNKKWSKYSFCTIPAIFNQDRITFESTLKLNSKNPPECNGNLTNIKKFRKKIDYNNLVNNFISTLLIILLLKICYIIYSNFQK
jgi:GR25 family glycosyltransferase involved in LPS biosynthesis